MHADMDDMEPRYTRDDGEDAKKRTDRARPGEDDPSSWKVKGATRESILRTHREKLNATIRATRENGERDIRRRMEEYDRKNPQSITSPTTNEDVGEKTTDSKFKKAPGNTKMETCAGCNGSAYLLDPIMGVAFCSPTCKRSYYDEAWKNY